MKCSICKEEIEVEGNWKLGNNAQPINNGRCCGVCNMSKVIPMRILESNYYQLQKKLDEMMAKDRIKIMDNIK